MKRIRKYLVWYFMFSKRLMHKLSFIILILLIPALVPLANSAMSDESGVLKIALCNEHSGVTASEIINSLMDDDGIILFTTCNSSGEATEKVRRREIDAAWIFPSDFDEKLDSFTSKTSSEPFIEIIERESTVPLQLSHEILYGAVFENVSYSLYKNFVYTNLVSENTVSESEVKRYYDNMQRNRSIIEIERLNSSQKLENINYLTAPLRGFLSLVVMLCTMAAAMYFLKDQAEGKYDWMPAKKRTAPAFASCLSAACFSGIAVFAALLLSNISVGFLSELISIVLFIVAATGFCLLLCVLFRSPGKLGASIPGIIIVMLVLSPIFFNVKVLRPVRLILPTYYYLQSTYNPEYYLYTFFYCMMIYAAAFLCNYLLNRYGRKISLC